MTAAEEMEVIGRAEVTEVTDGAGDTIVVIEETAGLVPEKEDPGHVEVSVELYGDSDHRRERFRTSRHAILLEVLDQGAQKLDVKLLPDVREPLDHLRPVYRDHETGEPLDLSLTVAEFLEKEPVTHHFAIELVLAIQINTRWRVAPEPEITPKAILVLAGLNPEEYSLYFPADSKEPLPPDTPVKLRRGQRFEAQRDGKYGWR